MLDVQAFRVLFSHFSLGPIQLNSYNEKIRIKHSILSLQESALLKQWRLLKQVFCEKYWSHVNWWRTPIMQDQLKPRNHVNGIIIKIIIIVMRSVWFKSIRIQGPWNGNLENLADEDINNSICSWSPRIDWKMFQ